MGARRIPEFGVPAGNFLKISQDTRRAGPYVLTDKISIAPPTKKRSDIMRDSQVKLFVTNGLLQKAVETSAERETLEKLSQAVKDIEAEYNAAFFGDAKTADLVFKFFEDRDKTEWDDFTVAIKDHFDGVVPDDGTCPTCGAVTDADAAGKVSESST